MGVVLHEQTFDDEYSKEIIEKARKLSPEIEEWFLTQRYLLEVDQQEVVDSEWLRNRMLCKIVDQLTDRGIVINQELNGMLDAPIFIDLILTLRAKFDQDNLYSFLVQRQELREEIAELLDDDCVDDVIEHCHLAMPIDEGWESLRKFNEERPGILMSTGVFTQMIEEVLARCDRLGDTSLVADDDMDHLLAYSKFLSDRKVKITDIASVIYATNDDGSINEDKKLMVIDLMREFESELSRPKAVRMFIDDSNEFDPKNYVEKLRSFYLSKWLHCLEYWTSQEHREEIPTDLTVAIMVATMFVDAPDKTHARAHVVETFENAIDLIGSRYDAFRDKIDRALGNLVVVEGGMNNALV